MSMGSWQRYGDEALLFSDLGVQLPLTKTMSQFANCMAFGAVTVLALIERS